MDMFGDLKYFVI